MLDEQPERMLDEQLEPMLEQPPEYARPSGVSPLRIVVLWLFIVPLFAFWSTRFNALQPTPLDVMPVAPKPGDTVVATLTLQNPAAGSVRQEMVLANNKRVLISGNLEVPGGSSKYVIFAHQTPVDAKAYPSFSASVRSGDLYVEQTSAAPGNNALVLSSFVSFAASSTTLMSSLINMSYYQSSFATSLMDFGLVLVFVMLCLTILVEATGGSKVAAVGGTLAKLRNLAHRYHLLLVSLYIIFAGLSLTRLAILFGMIT